MIRPCVDCKNEKQFSNIEAIRTHLLRRGFKPGYTCWAKHGEEETIHEGRVTDEDDDGEDDDTTAVEDTFVDTQDDLDQMLRDAEGDLQSERDF